MYFRVEIMGQDQIKLIVSKIFKCQFDRNPKFELLNVFLFFLD